MQKKTVCNVPNKPIKSKVSCKTWHSVSSCNPVHLVVMFLSLCTVSILIKLHALLNLINIQIPKIVRPVDSSNLVRLANSVNSNKPFCAINLSKCVRPIDIRKSIRLVNSNKTALSIDVLLMYVNLFVLLISVSLSLSAIVDI